MVSGFLDAGLMTDGHGKCNYVYLNALTWQLDNDRVNRACTGSSLSRMREKLVMRVFSKFYTTFVLDWEDAELGGAKIPMHNLLERRVG